MRERRKLPPNNLLREARRRTLSPSGSGRPMSRQELADELNAWLYAKTSREASLDDNYIGKLERGEHRWPNELYREAFRAALNASTDAELGFWIIRNTGPDGLVTVASWPSHPLAANTAGGAHRAGDMDRRALLKVTAVSAGVVSMPASLLWRAAHDSAQLSSASEVPALGATAVDYVRDDLRRLATDYVVTSDLPRILGETLLLRSRLSRMIEQRIPRPRELRELYLMMGATCLLLASISHDFGESDAGMMQARSAETFADLAEHPELLGWVLCTKAMIDLWRQRPEQVLIHASRGDAISVAGSGQLRLKGLEVRALAQLNRTSEAQALIQKMEDQRARFDHPGSLASLGAVFSFPESRQNYYAAVSHAQLGNYPAVERSVAALGHDDQPPQANGSWPVSWALSRSYLALARLDHSGSDGGPDSAAQALTPVLMLPEVQRINQLGQVFEDIERRLHAPAYRGNQSASALINAVRAFRAVPSQKAVTAL